MAVYRLAETSWSTKIHQAEIDRRRRSATELWGPHSLEEGKGKGYLASSRQYGNALLGVHHQEEKVYIGKNLLFAHSGKLRLWYIMADASQKGHNALTEREMATQEYVVLRCQKMTSYWQCSVRNQQQTCPTIVKQYALCEFCRRHHQHNHLLLSVSKSRSRYYTALKVLAVQDIFQTASQVIDCAMKSADIGQLCATLPLISNVKRHANRFSWSS